VYDYRKMTPGQQLEAVEYRRLHEHPLHSPPHMEFHGLRQFFITGTCYEHKHHIGLTHERMTSFEADLLTACEKFAASIYAWCILPNHYHVLVNYIHNNPVKHGYVDNWQDWLWSSAAQFLERVGRERALQIWREFPVLDYGKKWDVD